MKKIVILSVLSSCLCSTQNSSADILAEWTFENNGLSASYAPGANTATTNYYAELGLQAGTAAAIGFHSGAATYSSPSGNGTAKSFSVNTWSVDDYVQFTLSTVGYSGVGVSFDQVSSGTGPGEFYLAVSTDGVSFAQFGSTYTVLANSSPNNWSAGTPILTTTYSFDLSSLPALDNAASIYLRLVDASAVSANLGTVASGGTSRVDNFTVTAVPVPEPTAAAILGGFGVLGFFMAARRK